MADQTEYALCTSTGPGPWHLGQSPECTRRAKSATAASGILSATVRYRPRARHLSLQKRKSPRRLPPNRMVVPQELQVATRALLIGSTRPPDGWRLGCRALLLSRQRRLLHRHRLPAAVPPDEDAHVPDLTADREAAKRTRVVRDASENGHITIDPHRQTVVLQRRQPELTARDIADVFRFGTELAEARYFHEFVSDHARQR